MKLTLLGLFTFCLLTSVLSSCEKVDDTYKNWENNLKEFTGNTYEYFRQQPDGNYDSLLKALDRCPQLKQAVLAEELTVFALPNRSFTLSFDVLNKARRDSLPAMDRVNISTINDSILQVYLEKYFIKGKHVTSEISYSSDGDRYYSVLFNYPMHMQYVSTNASGYLGGGPKSLLFSNTNNSLNIANWSRVATTTIDIRTQNAIVNYLPANHIFGFGADFVSAVNAIK